MIEKSTDTKPETFEDPIKVGVGVGKEVLDKIKKAQKSIKIVSPYVNQKMSELLREKANEGIDVQLVTTSTPDGSNPYYFFTNFIDQKVHPIPDRRERMQLLRILAVLCFLACASLCIYVFQQKWNYWYFYCLSLILPFSFWKMSQKIRLFSYSYRTVLDLTILMSPYELPKKERSQATFLHSKIFIVDDEYAFIGSMNFTDAGFKYNHEVVVKLENEDSIRFLENAITELKNPKNHMLVDIDRLTRQLYYEPGR